MNVTLLSGIVATSAILFSLTAWSVDYRIGNFSRLSGIQAEAMDVNGGLDALELGPYDRLYVDLTGHEDPYAEIMSAFNGGATIILFSPDFVQAGPASIQTMERIQNKLRLFSNSRLLNYPLLKKLVIASIDHEYRPNFRSHQ
ncbi:hypothetical protein [Endozoicomonas atrinae]|uniref:hypothetical protein n=1 Tax=Endozoicomonas atrinae TaxID=1333660 RepID=UPI003B00DBE6